MANRSVKSQNRELDPMFYIPEGMEDDWAYVDDAVVEEATDADIDETVYEEDDFLESSETDLEEGEEEEFHDAPAVPENLMVVTQVLRRLPDGSNVVDLVVEVDDVPNIVKFDVRVTKA